jgi:hypothetical protein
LIQTGSREVLATADRRVLGDGAVRKLKVFVKRLLIHSPERQESLRHMKFHSVAASLAI